MRAVFLGVLLMSCAHKPIRTEKLVPVADGSKIWVKSSEDSDIALPTAIYLHGGPGYNSYTFEKATSDVFRGKIRILFVDQRGGAGRSELSADADLSMQSIVKDIEEIRLTFGLEKVNLIGHSFGGIVALEYLRRYPNTSGKIILVDISADLIAAFNYQVNRALEVAQVAFPQHKEALSRITASGEAPSKKLDSVYSLVGRVPLQRQLLFVSDLIQAKQEAWDEESGLQEKAAGIPGKLYAGLVKAGYLDSHHEELLQKVQVPAVLFAGSQSH